MMVDCNDPSVAMITTTAQINPAPDNYSGNAVVFTYNPFTVVPDVCTLSISCISVSPVLANDVLPCQELDGNNMVTWNFPDTVFTDNSIPPNTYTFTYEVKTGDMVTETFTVDVVLTNPCAEAKVIPGV